MSIFKNSPGAKVETMKPNKGHDSTKFHTFCDSRNIRLECSHWHSNLHPGQKLSFQWARMCRCKSRKHHL